MALLWMDGFDHYGGSTGNMTEGAWAELSSSLSISASNPRTGTNHIIDGSSTQTTPLRRVLGGAKTTVGIGAAFYLTQLPTGNGARRLFDFRDAANGIQVSIICQSTGTIAAYRGNGTGTLLGTSASPAIVAEAYQHVEAVVFFSNTVGTVEVRVNGVTVLSLSGQDTVNTANVECSQIGICGSSNGSNSGGQLHIDDIFCYDSSGSYNNTFIGDRRVLLRALDGDTSEADWTVVGAANGFTALATPDGDTSYISAGPVGSPLDSSEFTLTDMPAGVSAISAVQIVHMERKTEAGTANTQWSIISGASEGLGTSNPLTEIYTYRQDVFETDPASAAPFTASDVNGLLVKVTRTA